MVDENASSKKDSAENTWEKITNKPKKLAQKIIIIFSREKTESSRALVEMKKAKFDFLRCESNSSK